ncbi:MAG TPA: murein biosynthesis integral membrane protein MurJ [Beutenbergiaceae bacterium]|nr:murein biosynthesis integral membrane protein MurJ [Beutenbergiaceae bacterium]
MAKKTLAGSAAVMASGTLVSRVLGLARAAMLAAAIATVGGAADAFSVANKLPTIIYMLIAGGVLNAVLVPQIVRAMRQPDGGNRYVNQLLTLGTGVLAGVTALLTAGASVLLTLYAARMSPEWQPLALAFAYICLPQLFFYGLYTLLGQVLNARGNFGPYMWAPALNNIVSIIGLGVYLYLYGEYQVSAVTPADWDATRIWLVAGTATAGIAAQALVLLIPLHRSGFRLKPVFKFRGSGLGRASKVAGWAFAALAAGQLGYLVISNLAVAAGTAGSELGITIAGNASYDHAFTIFMLPQSLITVSLVTAMFTRLSHHAVAGEAETVRDQLSMGLRTLGVFTVFATAALMVLAIPVVALILAGSPTWEAQQAIGHVVVAFALGLVPIGAWTMVQRVYFAYEDTKSLFLIQIPMMLIVVASCGVAYLFFPPTWWVVVGAALGTTISNSFGAVVSYLALRRKLPSLDGARVLRTHLRLVIAVLPPTLLGWGLLHVWGVQAGLLGSLARVAVIGVLMGVGYLVLLRLLNVTELDGLVARVVGMVEPLTRRVSPLVARLPGSAALRKMGSFFAPSEMKAGVVSEQWEAGDVIADRYRLISRASVHAGEEYSLTTWQAEDTILAKSIRALILTGDADRVAAALDAARRRAVLTDPYFPRIYRVLEAGEAGVVITGVVDGPNLTELIANGAISAEEVRSVVGEAATGLERARRQGVQHLALTPDSIALHDGSVQVLGLGFEAALKGVSAKSSELGARKDTVALAQILFAGLSGKWVGSQKTDLPPASQAVSSAQQLHELAPDAPMDLIRLAHLTISPFEEGPHTPGELAESLRPWQPVPSPAPAMMLSEDFTTGSFDAVAVSDNVDSPPAPAPHEAEDSSAGEESHEHSDPSPEPAQDFGGHREGGVIAPASSLVAGPRGWDVPATSEPVEIRRTSVRPSPPAGSGDSTFGPAPERQFTQVQPPAPAATPPAVTPTSAAKSRDHRERLRSFTSGIAEQFRPVGDEPQERRFNPAGFVLLGMLALVVFALVLASSSLRSARNFEPAPLPPPTPIATETQEPEEPEATPEEEPEPTPEKEEPKPIKIKEAVSYDPSTGAGENQDLAHLAIDDDPSTIWRSLRYNDPTYAIKDGLGFSVVLEDETEVSEVVLLVDGKGGQVEVRAGDPKDPTKGDVLASGAIDHETTFTFEEPVETDTIVLWFPELPVADSDGMNRIELAEVSIE